MYDGLGIGLQQDGIAFEMARNLYSHILIVKKIKIKSSSNFASPVSIFEDSLMNVGNAETPKPFFSSRSGLGRSAFKHRGYMRSTAIVAIYFLVLCLARNDRFQFSV